jgi:hypothetical protein
MLAWLFGGKLRGEDKHMPDFAYTARYNGQTITGTFTLGDIKDPAKLVYRAEEELLKDLERQGFVLTDEEREYLESSIAVAVAKNIPSGRAAKLDDLQVRKREPEQAGKYTLINIDIGTHENRDYDPDQAIGAIIADIRARHHLGPNDHILLYQAVDGEDREIKPTMLVRELASTEIHWKVVPYQ